MFIGSMPANPTIADKFLWAQRWLYNAIGLEWRRLGTPHPLRTAISARLIGLVNRLNRVFGQWQAGTLRPPPARAARGRSSPRPSPQGGEGAERARKASAWGELPRGFGWLKKMLPGAGGEMNGFIPVLDDAEMRAIAGTAPQVGRILRPFCHVLGIPTPEYLRRPERRRKRWASPTLRPKGERKRWASPTLRLSEADEDKLRRITARFPDTPPARAAKRALRRMFAGLPVDVRKLSAVAYGYFVHPPRDDQCPPPEIGYGGRVFTPLPKDYVRPKDWE